MGAASAQYPYRVATIGPYQQTGYGWVYRPATYYSPYQQGWAANAYGAGYGYGGYYDVPIYDPAARELRRLRYAVEDIAYAPQPFPPLRPAFRPGPAPNGFDLPSRRAGRR